MAVSFSADDGIGQITLDKPPANSYDLEFIEELAEAVREAAADDAVKVVVVRSASERFFSAGADVKAFNENTVEANMEMIRASHETLSSIARHPEGLHRRDQRPRARWRPRDRARLRPALRGGGRLPARHAGGDTRACCRATAAPSVCRA